MPYYFLKAEYPILKKRKWLFPFYQPVRWIRALKNGLLEQTTRELGANAGSTRGEVLTAKQLLKELGL